MEFNTKLYRKRLIPSEKILLKNDQILYTDSNHIITKWDCLKPRKDISSGYSLYCLEKGFKLSKIYNGDHHLVYWYCDIIDPQYDNVKNELTVLDLLIDILIYEDGSIEVLDLDELALCLEQHLISDTLACQSMRRANTFLSLIKTGQIKEYQSYLTSFEND